MKFFKIIIALFFSFLFWGVCICFVVLVVHSLFQKNVESTTVNLHCQNENGLYQLVVPVQIGDNTYHFLWDTGASSSFISPFLVNELNFDIKPDTVIYSYDTVYETIIDSFSVQTINFNLGSLFINANFMSDLNNSISTMVLKKIPE